MSQWRQWSVMAPNAAMVFQGENLSGFYEELEKIAGVRLKRGRWTVPLNAIPLVADKAESVGAQVSAQWVIEPQEGQSWEGIEAILQESK